tara:strand:- start:4098 stop:4481 length:384 start_codon:yes stop_codon:yes gene_type:complete
MATKEIITELDRTEFQNLIKCNEGLVIIKFTASWCGPCKTIAPFVNDQFKKTPESVTCVNIDVDDNFDIFAYMKSKKMVKGVPTILAYKKDNKTFAPDFSVSGSDKDELINFFRQCVSYVNKLNQKI